MLLVDTTVLVYAVGDPTHPLSMPAKGLVRDIGNHTVRATTTPDVLQEFMHAHARRCPRDLVQRRVRRFAAVLSPLVTIDEDTILQAAIEYERRPSIGAFDAVLVAVALRSDDFEIVTADKAMLALDDVPTRSLESFT